MNIPNGINVVSRNGKIARLPRKVREELNECLQEGRDGKGLLRWLNSLDEVKDVLDDHFEGSPISAQNLSQWRQGGYVEWLAGQERRDAVRTLVDETEQLEAEAEGVKISHRLATLLSAELQVSIMAMLALPCTHEERWKRLEPMMRSLGLLRREDTKHEKVQFMRERAEAEEEAAIRKEETHHAHWRSVMARAAASRPSGGDEPKIPAADLWSILTNAPDFAQMDAQEKEDLKEAPQPRQPQPKRKDKKKSNPAVPCRTGVSARRADLSAVPAAVALAEVEALAKAEAPSEGGPVPTSEPQTLAAADQPAAIPEVGRAGRAVAQRRRVTPCAPSDGGRLDDIPPAAAGKGLPALPRGAEQSNPIKVDQSESNSVNKMF